MSSIPPGYLSKWANYIKGWKRRWFVIESPGVLVYYKRKPKAGTKPSKNYRGTVVLHLSIVTPDRNNRRRFTVSTGKETFYFRAKTPELRSKWIAAINEAKDFYESALGSTKGGARTTLSPVPREAGDESSSSTDSSTTEHKKIKSNSSLKELINLGDLIASAEAKSEALLSLADKATNPKLFAAAKDLMSAVRDCLTGMGGEVERRLRLEEDILLLEKENLELRRKISPEQPPPEEGEEEESLGEDSQDSDPEEPFYDAMEAPMRSPQQRYKAVTPGLSRPPIPSTSPSPSWMTSSSHASAPNNNNNNNNMTLATNNNNMTLATNNNMTLATNNNNNSSNVVSLGGIKHADEPILPAMKWRTSLPAPRPGKKESGAGLWTLLKNAIGKDLSKITLPAYYNEPITVTQRGAEEIEAIHLIHKAIAEPDSRQRLALVAAWAMSSYANTEDRVCKPFNPMLGETFEWDRLADLGCRYIAEQVSHHPPITALHVEGKDFTFHGDTQIRNKFWGNSLEVFPTGTLHLSLRNTRDHFTWSKVTTCVHNLFGNNKYVDNYGDMTITNHTTGEVAVLKFIKKGWLSGQYEVNGHVQTASGDIYCLLAGKWNEALYKLPPDDGERKRRKKDKEFDIADEPGAVLLWRSTPKPDHSRDQYSLPLFSMSLNETTREIERYLPPTDARWRGDQRALEQGDSKRATDEKVRLEEKQRAARRLREEKKEEWKPLWFVEKVDPVTQTTGWVFNGEYWKARSKGDWSKCPDLFS